MDFLQQVKKDIQQITTTDFATSIVFTSPLGESKTVKGYAGKHSLNVNEIGFVTVNSKECYCNVSEQTLLNAGYITRDSNGNLISFAKHLVNWTDVSGQNKTYIIQNGQSKSDETVGLLVFTLAYFKTPDTPTRIIIGWTKARILADVVSVNTGQNQTLANGDVIPLQYVPFDPIYDVDNNIIAYKKIAIPYLISVPGINILTTFMIDNQPIQNYTYSAGTFDNSENGGFIPDENSVAFDAAIPIWNF